MFRLSVAAIMLPLLLGAAPAPVSHTHQRSYVHYYFDTPRPLTIDTTRIAVYGQGLAQVRAAHTGIPGARTEPAGLPGIHFVALPKDRRSPAGVERSLDDAATLRGPSVTFTTPVFIGEDGGPVIPSPTLLVGFNPDADPAARDALLARLGTVLESDWAGIPGAYRIASPLRDGRAVLDAAALAATSPGVLFAEPDMTFTGSNAIIPNDPQFINAWGIHNVGQNFGGIGTVNIDMNGPEAWDLEQGDPSILTLIIDVGVDHAHTEIRRTPGADFTTDNSPNGDPFNACDHHGTPVAGCVSGKINNNLGAGGIAPGSRTVSARTFISSLTCDGTWTSNSSWTVNALAYAETLGCRVTNNSNRYGFTAAAIATKYAQTKADGMVHFAAAGNNAQMTVDYPSSLASVNAISACTNRGMIASFSNRGPDIFMTGPGLSIYSTDRLGAPGYSPTDFATVDGTSFASPYVAGVAALVLSANPALSPAQVESILASTAKNLGDPGYDTNFGWGLPNARAAVEAALAFTPCPADCDGSGQISIDDVDCFVTSFLAQLPAADCDGSGQISIDDIDCFVAAYLAGCP